jgi:hypothetical protein
MVTCPGLPGPELSDYLPRSASPARYGPGTEYHIGRISMVANTGTYLDSPFHRFADATDVAHLSLHSVADLDGVVVRIGAARRAIDRDALATYDVGGRGRARPPRLEPLLGQRPLRPVSNLSATFVRRKHRPRKTHKLRFAHMP